jgi:hypothetical protein
MVKFGLLEHGYAQLFRTSSQQQVSRGCCAPKFNLIMPSRSILYLIDYSCCCVGSARRRSFI